MLSLPQISNPSIEDYLYPFSHLLQFFQTFFKRAYEPFGKRWMCSGSVYFYFLPFNVFYNIITVYSYSRQYIVFKLSFTRSNNRKFTKYVNYYHANIELLIIQITICHTE